MDKILPDKTIVLIDDDFVIRQSIKKCLSEFSIFSSENGVEGLGLVYLTNPKVIIVDSTLPKYDGLEVIDYLVSNKSLADRQTPIILLVEKSNPDIDSKYPSVYIISKKDKHFIQKLREVLRDKGLISDFLNPLILSAANTLIRLGNRRDILNRNIDKSGALTKLFRYIFLITLEILISIVLTYFHIISGRDLLEENIPQQKEDLRQFRVRYYPTLIGILASILFILLQVLLFVGGGIVILNTRIESLFAIQGNEEIINLNNSAYDSTLIESIDGSIQLKQLQIEVSQPETAPSEEPIEEGKVIEIPTEETTPVEEVPEEQIEELIEESTPIESEEGVLGLVSTSDGQVFAETTDVIYSQDRPQIIFNDSIVFTKLTKIYEESNFNDKNTSEPDLNAIEPWRKPKSIEGLSTLELNHLSYTSLNGGLITYQLSPNKINWFYFGSEGKWELTEVGYSTSNTVQEINQFLDLYVSQVSGSELYIKAFLHSNGTTQVSLKNLIVSREITTFSEVKDPVIEAEDSDPVIILDDIISYPINIVSYPVNEIPTINFTLPSPTVLNAAIVGNRVLVDGRLEGPNKEILDISEEMLSNMKVKVYFTDSNNKTLSAVNTKELIGESNIFKISVNGISQYVWEVSGGNNGSGFVTAQLEFNNGTEILQSNLARPIQP